MDGDADEAAAAPAEVGGGTCGICLADARRAIRGELDCCGHRFCFVCIMAWARVESRCPFCKARFRTIRRPPVPGRFPSERIVTVAERNQVYHPLGNESSTVNTDPYADTSCSVCSCSRDEELLLLCELCDSAAHTYCVGLGTTIPEGDWFCADCSRSKEEHSRFQIDDGRSGHQGGLQICIELPRDDPVAAPSVTDFVDEDNYSPSSVQLTSAQSSRPPVVDPIPSIYDIVDEDYTTIPVHRTNARSNRLDRKAESSSSGSQCPESPPERDNGRVLLHAHARFEVERARTLHNSRNLSNRIRALRENWPALRAGSVGFAMQLSNSRRKNGSGTISVAEQHQGATHIVNNSQNGAGICNIERHQQSATAFTVETTTSSGHANKISPKDGRDVRKAWKMLDMAKSAGGKRKAHKPSFRDCSTPFSMGNRLIASSSSPIDTILGHNNNNMFDGITQKNNLQCNLSTKMKNTPPTKNFRERHNLPENCRVSGHGRLPPGIVNQDSFNGKGQPLESLCGTSRLEKPKSDILHPSTCSLLSGQSTTTSLPQLKPRARSQPVKMAKPQEPSVFATTNCTGTAEANKIRSSGPDHHKRKRKLDCETRDDQGSKRSKSCCKIAKTEISSLAIRELKLLKIDKTYGSDRFKEVARAATHAVLASCGLEHSPSLAHALSRPICEHDCVSKHLKSPALSNSCGECLRSFVKEVISSMLPGVKMDQTATSC